MLTCSSQCIAVAPPLQPAYQILLDSGIQAVCTDAILHLMPFCNMRFLPAYYSKPGNISRLNPAMLLPAAAVPALLSMCCTLQGTWEFRMRLKHSLAMESDAAAAGSESLPRHIGRGLQASPRQHSSGGGSARPLRSMTPPPSARPPSSDWLV